MAQHGRITVDRRARRSAQQAINGLAEELASEIPQCAVHGRDGHHFVALSGMPILAVQHVPHSFIGERVLADHMLRQLGQHDRRGLVEDRTELAGGTVIRDDLDVGVCHPIGATAGPTPSKLGIDIQHL